MTRSDRVVLRYYLQEREPDPLLEAELSLQARVRGRWRAAGYCVGRRGCKCTRASDHEGSAYHPSRARRSGTARAVCIPIGRTHTAADAAGRLEDARRVRIDQMLASVDGGNATPADTSEQLRADFNFNSQAGIKREQIERLHGLGFSAQRQCDSVKPTRVPQELPGNLARNCSSSNGRMDYVTVANHITSFEGAAQVSRLSHHSEMLGLPSRFINRRDRMPARRDRGQDG